MSSPSVSCTLCAGARRLRRWPAAWPAAARALAWVVPGTLTTRPSCSSPTTPRTSGRPACSLALSRRCDSMVKVLPPLGCPESDPMPSRRAPGGPGRLQMIRAGMLATGVPATDARASRLPASVPARRFHGLYSSGGVRDPVALCEVRAEEGWCRVVSTRWHTHLRRTLGCASRLRTLCCCSTDDTRTRSLPCFGSCHWSLLRNCVWL